MTSPRQQERETFSSVWGMALALLGVAIGLGNFWRFPYMMGIFGGGAFLAVYLFVVAVVGVPALLAELTLGRATGRGPALAFAAAGLPAGRQIGGLLFVGVAMAMTYYLVVLGWLAVFFCLSLGAAFGVGTLDGGSFAWLHAQWGVQVAAAGAVAAAAAWVVGRGVRDGIERISRLFLPAFGALTLLLAAWSLSLPGAADGLRYLFTFDAAALTPRAVMAAVGQAFFSLGLGGTFLVIYGSYLPADAPLPRRAVTTAAGDVAASLLAVVVIMPLAFAYGLSPASGPPLLFEVLPTAFAAMPGGDWFGALFFLGLGCIVAGPVRLVPPAQRLVGVRGAGARGRPRDAVARLYPLERPAVGIDDAAGGRRGGPARARLGTRPTDRHARGGRT